MAETAKETFPYPVRWRTSFDWFFLAYHRPVVADSAIVRCGEYLVALDPADGAVRWRSTVDSRGGDGAIGVAYDRRYIAAFHRQPERLSSLKWFDFDGHSVRHVDLPAVLARDAAVVVSGNVIVLGSEPAAGPTMYTFDAASGDFVSGIGLPWGGEGLVPIDGGLLVRSTGVSHGSGLYRMGVDGEGRHAIEKDGVWELARDGDWVVTVSRKTIGGPRTITVRRLPSTEIAWSAEVAADAMAIDGDRVFCIGVDEGFGALVARDVETGREIWRGPPFAVKASDIKVAGPLVFASDTRSCRIHDRADGRVVGELSGFWGPPVASGDSLFVSGNKSVVCLALR
jgi:hypothetical protein